MSDDQQNDSGQQQDTQQGDSSDGRVYSQADIDRIVNERALRLTHQKYADYDDLKTKAAEFDKLAEQNRTEAEKAIAAARAEGKSEAQKAANDRLLKADVRALAAGKLADPADAVRLLDLSQFTVGEDGETDEKAIAAAIDQLVKDKPYLAAKPTGFQGTGDGGARSNGSGPKQVTEQEFNAMTPEQRVKARQEGRLTQLLGG